VPCQRPCEARRCHVLEPTGPSPGPSCRRWLPAGAGSRRGRCSLSPPRGPSRHRRHDRRRLGATTVKRVVTEAGAAAVFALLSGYCCTQPSHVLKAAKLRTRKLWREDGESDVVGKSIPEDPVHALVIAKPMLGNFDAPRRIVVVGERQPTVGILRFRMRVTIPAYSQCHAIFSPTRAPLVSRSPVSGALGRRPDAVRSRASPSVRLSPQRWWALMAHPLIDDMTFALALAAWWQLRRSAYLLPHLRKCPFWSGRSPATGLSAWAMANVRVSPLTAHSRRRPGRQARTDNDDGSDTGEQATDALYLSPVTALPPSPSPELTPATIPILVPSGLRPPPPSPPRHALPPTMPLPRAATPRARASWDAPTLPSSAGEMRADAGHRGMPHGSIDTSTRRTASPRGAA